MTNDALWDEAVGVFEIEQEQEPSEHSEPSESNQQEVNLDEIPLPPDIQEEDTQVLSAHLAQLTDANNNIQSLRQAPMDVVGCWTGEEGFTSPQKQQGREWYFTLNPVQHTCFDSTLTEQRILQAREIHQPATGYSPEVFVKANCKICRDMI